MVGIKLESSKLDFHWSILTTLNANVNNHSYYAPYFCLIRPEMLNFGQPLMFRMYNKRKMKILLLLHLPMKKYIYSPFKTFL